LQRRATRIAARAALRRSSGLDGGARSGVSSDAERRGVRCGGVLERAHLALVASVTILTPAEAVDISSCGQTVPPGAVGVLQADVACPSVVGVHLGLGATLDMNGHAITAGSVGVRLTIARSGVFDGEICFHTSRLDHDGRIECTDVCTTTASSRARTRP